MATSFNSPTYPYERVQIGYNRFKGAEYIPYKLLMYLLDLPDKHGYEPVDDNNRPRVRLAKYLWYDGARPLSQALPTPAQKLSLLFDGEEPVLETDEQKANHPKGYRLFWQVFWGQSQTEAKTLVKCYLGRILPVDENVARIGITFEILSNVNLQGTTRTDAYERAYAIEQCIIESLAGVNIAGIGVVDFARMSHTDNGSRPIADSGTVVGRELHVSLTWAESIDYGLEDDYTYVPAPTPTPGPSPTPTPGGELKPATRTTLGGIIVGDNLLITEQGVLSVDTANAVEQDNTKPITAAAVYVEVGNIDALLQTI